MRILRDYVLKEFFHSFFLTVVVFTFVFLVGNIITLANYIINKGVEALSVFKLFIYLIPWLLSFTLPIAVLTASILSFGRLSADGELIAMRASGISLYRVSMPIIMVGVLLSFFAFFLNDQVSPNASFASRRVIKEIGIRSPAAALEEGTFIRGFENYIIFIHEINGNNLRNIRIYQPQENRPTRTIIAKHGEFISVPEKGIVKLKLADGTSEEPDPNDPVKFYKLNFKTYYMTLNIQEKRSPKKLEKKAREMSIKEIKTELKKLGHGGIEPEPLLSEFHKKFAMSFSAFVFVLIGIPLAIKTHRGEKTISLGISLGLLVIYWVLLAGGTAFALRGKLSPWFAIWLPNIVIGSAGLFLFYKIHKS